MQVRSSYGAEIRKQNIPLSATLDIYRKSGCMIWNGSSSGR